MVKFLKYLAFAGFCIASFQGNVCACAAAGGSPEDAMPEPGYFYRVSPDSPAKLDGIYVRRVTYAGREIPAIAPPTRALIKQLAFDYSHPKIILVNFVGVWEFMDEGGASVHACVTTPVTTYAEGHAGSQIRASPDEVCFWYAEKNRTDVPEHRTPKGVKTYEIPCKAMSLDMAPIVHLRDEDIQRTVWRDFLSKSSGLGLPGDKKLVQAGFNFLGTHDADDESIQDLLRFRKERLPFLPPHEFLPRTEGEELDLPHFVLRESVKFFNPEHRDFSHPTYSGHEGSSLFFRLKPLQMRLGASVSAKAHDPYITHKIADAAQLIHHRELVDLKEDSLEVVLLRSNDGDPIKVYLY